VKRIKEDVYFYLDLTKDLLKKKEIVKAIKYYIEEKNKVNIKGHYSLLIFQEEGNPIFITDKKDAGIIIKSIDENWKLRAKNQSFLENGLFYIFSYIAETVRKKSKFNRIIIITDTPSDLSEGYQEALFNLVSKIKNFPTFIDIIRFSSGNERFFSDDVKLNMLASDTKGGIFYVKEKKEFLGIIKKLIKTKQYVDTYSDRPDRIKISTEDYAFYNNLAKSLKKSEKTTEKLVCHICKEEICPVCTDVYDIPQLCEDCNAGFHNCCITNYTINYNIGIPNILRCPSCDVLLKIDEDEIIEVSGEGEAKTVKEYMESLVEIPPYLPSEEELPISSSPVKQAEKRTIQPTTNGYDTTDDDDVIKTIRIGGFFGKAYKVKKVGDKIVYERIMRQGTNTSHQENTVKQQEKLVTTTKNSSKGENKLTSFAICQQCGIQINPNQDKYCPNCGFKVE